MWAWGHLFCHLLGHLSVQSMDFLEISFSSWKWLCCCFLINIRLFSVGLFPFCEIEIVILPIILPSKACKLKCIRGSCRMTKSGSRWQEALPGPSDLPCHDNVTRRCHKATSDFGLQIKIDQCFQKGRPLCSSCVDGGKAESLVLLWGLCACISLF